MSSCSKLYIPTQQSTEMQFSLSSEKCKASVLPQRFLMLSSDRLREVQMAQDAFREKFSLSSLTHKGNGHREGSAICLVKSLGHQGYGKGAQGGTLFRMSPI